MPDETLDSESEPAGESPPTHYPAIPGYEIFAELGRGGMGVVYRAREVRAKRDVAIKMVLSGRYASARELQRFRTEAEAAAGVIHPNLLPVMVVGDHDGHPYLVLEYCPGGSLDDKLAAGPLPPRAAAELVAQLAGTVQAAHARRVIHRDLKPANVLFDGEGRPKVTDFGLAKQMDADANQTASGAILGTPSYMAPEQAAGASLKVGPGADIYGLGAILYHALVGRPPHKGESATDTLLRVLQSEPERPRAVNPAVPRDLESVCLKCLAKRPAERYATAAELEADLRRYLVGEPVRARRVGRATLAGRWAGRHATKVAMVVLLVATAAGFAASVRRPAPTDAETSELETVPPPRPPMEVRQRESIGGIGVQVEGVLRALTIGVNNYARLQSPVGEKVGDLRYAGNDAARLADALGNSRHGTSDITVMTTDERTDSGQYPTAAAIRAQLEAVAEGATAADDIVVSFAGYEAQFAGSDEYYFCPADADRGELKSLIPLSEICDVLARSKAKSKLVLIDSCREREEKIRPPKPPPEGVAVLFACSGGENSFEATESQSGIFTRQVGLGLAGSADADGDRRVSLKELAEFVRPRVTATAQRLGCGQQTPELVGRTGDLAFPVPGPREGK